MRDPYLNVYDISDGRVMGGGGGVVGDGLVVELVGCLCRAGGD